MLSVWPLAAMCSTEIYTENIQMIAINGNRITVTLAIVLASLIFSSSCVLDEGQTYLTIDQVVRGDSGADILRDDDNGYKGTILEASHKERDSRRVNRFAHEARVQAGEYRHTYQH
jgi:hypothetical protein